MQAQPVAVPDRLGELPAGYPFRERVCLLRDTLQIA
jgi:hypothetical protein